MFSAPAGVSVLINGIQRNSKLVKVTVKSKCFSHKLIKFPTYNKISCIFTLKTAFASVKLIILNSKGEKVYLKFQYIKNMLCNVALQLLLSDTELAWNHKADRLRQKVQWV